MDAEKGACLGAVIVPSDPSLRRVRHLQGRDILALRQRLLPIFPKGSVPKRYRFVDELPRNAQGKILAAELKRLFNGDDS